MYVIRETFTAKPGQASKLARMFTEMTKEMPMPGNKSRVLTDFIGPYNTVVWEVEVKEISEFEKMMKEYAEKPEAGKKMAGYTEMYLTGKREIYRVVG
jgi:heme-degrading monooxygenase HmoA